MADVERSSVAHDPLKRAGPAGMAFATKTAFPPRPRRRTRRATRARRDFGVFFGRHGRTRDVRTSTRSTRASSSRSRASRTPPRRFPSPARGEARSTVRLGRFREERIRRRVLSVTRRVVVVRDKRVLAGCVRATAFIHSRRRAPPRPPARAPARAAPCPSRLQSRRVEDGDARAARARDHRGGPRRGAEQCRRERARRPRRTPGRRPPFLTKYAVGLRLRAARLLRHLRKRPREEHAERGRARARGEHRRLPRPRLDQPRDACHRRARASRRDHARALGANPSRTSAFPDDAGICGIRFLRRLRRSSSVCLRRFSSAARDVGVLRGRRRREEPPLVQPNRRRVGERAERARRQRGARPRRRNRRRRRSRRHGRTCPAFGAFSPRREIDAVGSNALRESPRLRAVRAGHVMDAAAEDGRQASRGSLAVALSVSLSDAPPRIRSRNKSESGESVSQKKRFVAPADRATAARNEPSRRARRPVRTCTSFADSPR